MSLINNKSFQITTKFFFVSSLLMIAFGVADALLRNFEIVEITFSYHLVWLFVVFIALLLLAMSIKWKKFFVLLFLALGNFVFVIYLIAAEPISYEKPIENSNYLLNVALHHYKIEKQNLFYKKIVASKSSEVFFHPNMKTGIVPFFEATLVSETREFLILKIQTSGKPSIIDTIRKF